VKNISATLAIVWRIAAPYFRSEDKWAGRGLLGAVIAMELALVAIDVLVNQWQNRFYSALQASDWDAFVTQIWIFIALASIYIALAVYKLYLNQWLQIRWRQWLTRHYLGEWLQDATHYRMQLKGDAADNPDQRITEDVKNFVEQTLTIGLGLLSSIVTRIVIEKTGLDGAFDIDLVWSRDQAIDTAQPSMFTALQEQLGLKLESSRGPVEVLVIDHVEPPSPD